MRRRAPRRRSSPFHCGVRLDAHARDTCRTQVPEYEAWKDSIGSNASKFSVKYYKGLGTSTAAEARDYFSDLATHQLDFDLLREGDGDLVDMAFSKKRVEDRKTWLRSLEPGAFVDYGVDALAYKTASRDVVHKESIVTRCSDTGAQRVLGS